MRTEGLTLKLDEHGNVTVTQEDLSLFFDYIRNNVDIVPSGMPFIRFDSEKFNTCLFRQKEIMFKEMPTCCDTVIVSGFYCKKLDKFEILPEFCFQCSHYKK